VKVHRLVLILIALALVPAVAGCSTWFQSSKSEGAWVHSLRDRDKTTAGSEAYTRRFIAMPVPASPAPGAANAPLPARGQWVPVLGVEEKWEWVGPTKENDFAEGMSHGANVKGPGVTAKQGAAPEVNLEEGTASGGTFSYVSKLAQVFQGPMVLVWIGGVALLAGLVMIFAFKLTTWGTGVTIGGGALAAIGLLVGLYPWVLLVGLGAVALGGLGFLLWVWKTKQVATALDTVVAGVETAPAEASATVKTSIGAAADAKGVSAAVKGIVSAVKARLAALGVLR
jgi:hypothetical protein